MTEPRRPDAPAPRVMHLVHVPLPNQALCDRLRRLTETYGIMQAAEIAGTSANAIRKVRARAWIAAPARSAPRRPIPSDFSIQCDAMTAHELAKHYRAGQSTICRWSREVGRKSQVTNDHKRFAIPVDLSAMLRRLTMAATARHYGVSEDTIRRWRRDATLDRHGKPLRATVGWAERRAAQGSASSLEARP